MSTPTKRSPPGAGSYLPMSSIDKFLEGRRGPPTTYSHKGPINPDLEVFASTGPVFVVKGSKQVAIHSISFSNIIARGSPLEVRNKAVKKKLFAKLCEDASFSEMFTYDQMLFDGKARLFLPESAGAPKESLMFPINFNAIAYEVSIKFVGHISFNGAIEGESFNSLGALLALICGNQSIEPDSINAEGWELDRSTLTSLSASLPSPQLAVKSVQSMLPECCAADLAGKLGLLNNPVPNFKLYRRWLEDAIVGLRVSQMLSGRDYGNNRVVSIGMPAKDQPIDATKACPTVSEYSDSIGQSLKHPELPVVNVNSKLSPVWIPMEKLRIIGGQHVNRKVSAALMSGSINRSAANYISIAEKIQQIMEEGDFICRKLNKFGLTVEHKKREANRVTAVPVLHYIRRAGKSPNDGTATEPVSTLNGQWKIGETTEAMFHTVKQVHPEHILNIQSGRPVQDTDSLAYALGMYGNKVKRCFHPAHKFQGTTHVKQASAKTVDQLPTKSEIFGGAKSDVLLVLLPSSNPVQFSNIKLWADCVEGIRTVCTVKGRGAICFQHPEQLAMKINHHAGGINYLTPDVGTGLDDCMVVGISVSHPDKNAVLTGGCQSVVSVVANSDKNFLNFPGEMRFQPHGTKEISELKDMIARSVEKWSSGHGGKHPTSVLVYRTGISKLAYTELWQNELAQIVEATTKTDQVPSVTIILVEKNHKTKFFQKNDLQALPGLYVEGSHSHQITDFYLQSHGVMQPKIRSFGVRTDIPNHSPISVVNEIGGRLKTWTPTVSAPDPEAGKMFHPRNGHYSIFSAGTPFKNPEDQNDIDRAGIMNATYKFCWNTVHSTSALSYASPAYYANKLCERGLVYLKPVVDGKMSFSELKDKYFKLTAQKRNPWNQSLDGEMFYI